MYPTKAHTEAVAILMTDQLAAIIATLDLPSVNRVLGRLRDQIEERNPILATEITEAAAQSWQRYKEEQKEKDNARD